MGYDLTDRVVFITGASGGIGRACAAAYVRAGAMVAAAARSTDRLESLADELGRERLLPVTMDVTDAAQRETGLAKARERFGLIDVLVNNAGWSSFATVQRMPEADFDRMIALNFVAPIALTRAVLPEMIQRRSGQIINISSVVGEQVIPRMTVYSATKAALTSFTSGLRMELRHTGVDALLVAPGSTNTDFFESASRHGLGIVRLGTFQDTPERVARAVVKTSRTRRPHITLTLEAKSILLIRRFSRRVADRIMYHIANRSMPLKDE